VSDIVTAQDEDIQPAPSTSSDAVVPYLEGLVAQEDRMVMVLDLLALTTDAELPEAA
jgi:purine-binding chemotaxis protein CheW